MPRYDDDRDDDYDDRPRRRAKSGGSGVGLILGIVGGVILVVVIGCAGLAYWMVTKVSDTVDQAMTSVAGSMTAETWMKDIQQGKTKQAYDATSSTFKSKQTLQQFEQFVEKNPTLTKHTFRSTTSFNTTQRGDTQNVVIRMRLHTSESDDLLDGDEDEDLPRPKPKPKPKGIEKDPGVPEIDVTITMVNEDGVWKVHSITIP